MPLDRRPTVRRADRRRARYAWCAILATWRSGYAAACKAVYTGSIPVVASLGQFCPQFQFAPTGCGGQGTASATVTDSPLRNFSSIFAGKPPLGQRFGWVR
jgi:hypothetical protein